ncbi:MAG: acyl-CoA reductase [Polyangiaceae bacterium]
MFAVDQGPARGLLRWIRRVAVLADPTHPLGRRAHDELPESTGLSRENVAWGLAHSLERHATATQLGELIAGVTRCETAHVLLSANVFTAALRAVALAKASAARVLVRPSRREPLFAQLLHDADPSAFELVDRLQPAPEDHVWAYGADATLQTVSRQWPAGVVLHGHGNGYGVLVVSNPEAMTRERYDDMALDIAAFDQRGCLSPRIAIVEGDDGTAEDVGRSLFEALRRIQLRLPLGRLTQEERAERLRYRELMRYLGDCFEADGALVGVAPSDSDWIVPPPGRVIHVQATTALEDAIARHARDITNIGVSPAASCIWRRSVPRARVAHWGRMQCPPLDGPADRRPEPRGRTVEARTDERLP